MSDGILGDVQVYQCAWQSQKVDPLRVAHGEDEYDCCNADGKRPRHVPQVAEIVAVQGAQDTVELIPDDDKKCYRRPET